MAKITDEAEVIKNFPNARVVYITETQLGPSGAIPSPHYVIVAGAAGEPHLGTGRTKEGAWGSARRGMAPPPNAAAD